ARRVSPPGRGAPVRAAGTARLSVVGEVRAKARLQLESGCSRLDTQPGLASMGASQLPGGRWVADTRAVWPAKESAFMRITKLVQLAACAAFVAAATPLGAAAPTTVKGEVVDVACYTKNHTNKGDAHK